MIPLTPLWALSHRADDQVRPLADRHYNRQKIGAKGFAPPGRCLVLKAPDSFWITSWPYPEYVMHAWAGAWINSAFRNEGAVLSSERIRDAVALTRARWPEPPGLGMVTFVDARKTRHKRDPGRCYVRAGFRRVGFTVGGLHVLQMLPGEMPPPATAGLAQCLPQLQEAVSALPRAARDAVLS
jgi:hypothetical protein